MEEGAHLFVSTASLAHYPRRFLSLLAAAVLATAVVVPLSVLVTTGSAAAAPTASWDQLEKVGEQYKQNQAELEKSQAASAALAKQMQPLQAKADTAYQQVSAAASMAYKGGNASALNVLLSSGSPGSMLDQLTMLDRLAAGQHTMLATYQKATKALGAQKSKYDAVVAADTKKARDLAAQK